MKSKPGPDPIAPARDFTSAYRALKKSLIDDRKLFDAYYVSRTDSPVEELKSRLLVDDENCHTLYLGTRKSGKTTELGRLAYELDNRFLVVYISVLSDMEPSDVKPIDLLLFSTAKLAAAALEADVKIGRDMENDIADWLLQNTNEVFRTKVTETGGGARVGAKLNAVVAELNASFGVDATIYTADKALVYLPTWNLVRASFPQPVEVRSLATVKRNGSPNEVGINLLKDLLLRRVQGNLFESDALKKLTEICNGVMGDLLEVAQSCCTAAMAENSQTITWDMVDRRYQGLSDNFRRMIDETEYPRLAEIHKTREAKKDASLGSLLFMHAVIEYRDAQGLYYDVHPAIVPILKQKKLIPA
ncbi:MAG: hypothetical protein NTX53_17535 [candidate division WOR-3 bacterium]|nr:hypothetical protein [candidate division WOR-3 bacterium]